MADVVADDFLHGGLVEDEDGAPYPEHVQQIIRCLGNEVLALRDRLVFADAMVLLETGHSLAHFHAEDSEAARVIERAGCHHRDREL